MLILLTVSFAWSTYFIVVRWLFIILCILRYILNSIPRTFCIASHVVIFMIARSIRPIKVFLFIIVSIRVRTLSFAAPCLKIIFIKRTINAYTLSLRTSSTIYTFYTFLFRVWNVDLSCELLFSLFIDIGKPKYIPIWIQKCKWWILFILQKLNLQIFSI